MYDLPEGKRRQKEVYHEFSGFGFGRARYFHLVMPRRSRRKNQPGDGDKAGSCQKVAASQFKECGGAE